MKIEVDLDMFNALIECIDKQAILDKQTPEVQAQWTTVINNVSANAKAALQQYLKTTGHSDSRRTEIGQGPMISPGSTPYL